MTKAVNPKKDSSGARRVGIVVLGMHRSGTSALARVLSLLGCDLPKTLMDANPTNEAGHWESSAIMRLNDEILNSAGSSWQDWQAFNPGWYSSPKAAEFKERALAALEDEFGQSRLFVLKDPRICRFAPFWLDVLEAADVRPAIIMPMRNPLEVAESLAKRDGLDPALGHLLWLRHVLEAEAGTRGRPRFHTSYEGLLDGWPRLIAGTQEGLGISWPRLSGLVSEEIGAFLTERLRHHRQAAKAVSDNPLLSAWLRDAFAIFSRWSEEGEAAEDHAALDRIHADLDAAAPAFSRLISAGQQSAQKATALDASLKETQGKLLEAETAVTEQQNRVNALEQQLEQTRSAHSASQAAVADKDREIAEAAERLAGARSELADMQAEVQSLRAALDETRGQLSHTQSALAQRSAEADEVAAQLREKETEFASALDRSRMEKEEAERRLAAELEAERTRLAERFDEIAALSKMLHEREAEIVAAQDRSGAEKEAAERRLEEAERAGRLAEELEAERARLNARFEEIVGLNNELREKKETIKAMLERTRAEKESAERRVAEVEATHRLESERAGRLAKELEAERERATAQVQKLRSEKGAAEGRLAERFSEIAVMTRLLGEKESAARLSDEQTAWLREVSAVLMNGTGEGLKGRLAALMPAPIRLAKQKKRLKRKGIFDSDAYLAAYPDVAEAGLDPLWHYINHGMGEGRQLHSGPMSGDIKKDHETG